MSNFKALEPISEQKISATGVVSLAIRPNQNNSQYGIGNLTGKELQKKFDNLARLAIARCNELVRLLSGKYLPSEDSPPESAESILEYILAFKGSESENIPTDMSLKDVLDNILTTSAELKAIDPTVDDRETFAALNTVLTKIYGEVMDRFYAVEEELEDKASRNTVEKLMDDLSNKANVDDVDVALAEKVNNMDIVDNLMTNDPKKVLSAAQGAALRRMIEIGGGGSGGSGGFSSLEWTSEVDENKLVYAVRFGKVVVSIPFDPTSEVIQYKGTVQLNAIHPFTLGGFLTQAPFSAGFMYLPLKDNEKLFYVTQTALGQYYYYGYCLTDGKTYDINGYEPNRWLQPVPDTTLLAAFEELHEYAQDIISGVSE